MKGILPFALLLAVLLIGPLLLREHPAVPASAPMKLSLS